MKTNLIKTVVCLMFFCGCAVTHSEWYSSLGKITDNTLIGMPSTREHAFQILLSTDLFAREVVGYAGECPIQVIAFYDLLCQPNAREVFIDLLNRSNSPGQLYALCGLWFVSPLDYNKEVQSYLTTTNTVAFFDCCDKMSGYPISNIVEYIEYGRYPVNFRNTAYYLRKQALQQQKAGSRPE